MTEQTTTEPEAQQASPVRSGPRSGGRARIVVAVAAAISLAAAAIGYSQLRDDQEPKQDTPVTVAKQVSLEAGPRLLTLSPTGQVTTVSTVDSAEPRAVSEVKCDRIYAAAGTGACLKLDGVLATVELVLLDKDLKPREAHQVSGLPNRVRVSQSGRMVGWTLFVDGEGYAELDFSTRTGIWDTRTGERVDSMETFQVIKDGVPYRTADLNFWGVTFTKDDNTFYATMHADKHRYLVEGDFAAKRVTVLKDVVECPSVSPDGSRIAFKEAVRGDYTEGWRLSVLDLATMKVTHTAETNSVDDQAAWLDDNTLGYALRRSDGIPDLWTVPADGSGQPTLRLKDASSPAPLG